MEALLELCQVLLALRQALPRHALLDQAPPEPRQAQLQLREALLEPRQLLLELRQAQSCARAAPGARQSCARRPGHRQAVPAGKRRSCNTNVNSPNSKELIEIFDQLFRIW